MRLDIQGLRAVAVLLVVFSHAGIRHLAGGYVGVDVFFVISGFLITSQILREVTSTGRVAIGRFYARRALRLLPASTLVGVVTLAGAWLWLSKARFIDYAGDAVASAFYFVNFRLAESGADYLNAAAPPSPFQHFWSLAVEEQFYLVWPVLLFASWRLLRRRTLVAIPLALLCTLSFVVNISLTAGNSPWAYFGSQTRAWELGLGALLALGADRFDRLPATVAAPLSWAGLAAIAYAGLVYDDSTRFPGWYAAVPVLGTVAVLAGGAASGRFGAVAVLGLRPAVWIGGVSYSWYLWHWPLMVILPHAVPSGLPVGAVRLGAAALGLVLAWLTLRLVENPVRFNHVFKRSAARGLALGLGLSAGTAAIALVAAQFPPALASDGNAPSLAGTVASAEDPLPALQKLLANPDHALPANLTQDLRTVGKAKSAIYLDGCMASYTSDRVPAGCEYGDTSSSTVVALYGDSHAAQWFPALEELAKQNHWKLVALAKASCKVAWVTTKYQNGPYTTCDTWRKKAVAKIQAAHAGVVITSSSNTIVPWKPEADWHAQWLNGYATTYRALQKGGAKVVTLLDTPSPKGNAVDCVSNHSDDLSRCTQPESKVDPAPDMRRINLAAAQQAGVSVIDPEAWFCVDGRCPAAVGDTVVYRDDSHVAESYATAIAPLLRDSLTDLFGPDLDRVPRKG
ncbi:acyltransferase [Streptomyces sp. JH14]|uniref:acyltransferase family protein n=1 Tax=Streptomyces sp. JH14 TaxID=2793630 RepID=UPI0023F6B346|nr:acyltransferase family protein [Streptomyces sp. JH14]MDF6044432.1 acyltransferase [Streptomyces sp. JH14]